MLTVQGAVPPQPPPDQPVNFDPALGAAVSVTDTFWAKLAEQAAPQWMPAGAEVTVPDPVPVRATCRPKVTAGASVVANTLPAGSERAPDAVANTR
jgi:hypothetical protein